MALAAASMSANVFGFTAGVWAMTAAVATSTFSTALQHGQVTSKLDGLLGIYANHTANSPIQAKDAFLCVPVFSVVQDCAHHRGHRGAQGLLCFVHTCGYMDAKPSEGWTLSLSRAQGLYRLSLIGKMWSRLSISQPSRNTDTTTTATAISSPKLMRRRLGSMRRVARLRMLRVAKPNTTAQRML